MPSKRIRLAILALVLAAAPALSLLASDRDVPITTSSAQARQLYLQARDKAENIEMQAARTLAAQAAEKDGAFAMAYLLLSETGDASSSESRQNLDKAVSLAANVSPGERHWIMASKAETDGDVNAVKAHLQELESAFPDDKRVQLRIGMYQQFVARNLPQAAVHLRKATTIDPSFAPAYNLLGYVHMNLAQYADAEAAFRKYVELLPDRPNPYDSYAEMLMKVGRYDESIAQYRKALEKDGSFVSSLAGIGANQLFKGDYQAARESFEQERAKAPTLGGQLTAMDHLALSYVHEGKTTEAVRVYDEIASKAQDGGLAPRMVGARLEAALVLNEAGRSADAAAQIDQAEALLKTAAVPPAVETRLKNAAALGRVRVLAAKGQYTAANAEIARVRPAVEQRAIPAELATLNETLGFVALRQKRYKDAMAFFQKGDPNNPLTMYERGLAEEKLGRANQAATLFDKVANWNANDLGYALIRSEATKKSEAVAVATRGKKQQ